MILELDVGNTRIKWRQISASDGACIAAGVVSDAEELLAVTELRQVPLMVRMCSVRGGDLNQQLQQWSADSYGLEIQTALVSASCGGVSNQYADPARLGIDRWLAMLAAFKRAAGPCVVIDGGTAFTVDVLNSHGQHRGGYIVPGLALMRGALEANTRIRLSEDNPEASRELGHSTDDAVRNGTLSALLALIARVAQSVSGPKSQAKLYFTGGDAELLHELAAIESSEVVPSLVFDGLGIACPFEEKSQ